MFLNSENLPMYSNLFFFSIFSTYRISNFYNYHKIRTNKRDTTVSKYNRLVVFEKINERGARS